MTQLTDELRKIKEIGNLENGLVRTSPSSSHWPLKIEDFAAWLLAQSRFRAPSACMAELLATIRANESRVLEIMPVWGMAPKARFDLRNGISILPIEDLPSSRLKDLMMHKRRHQFSFEIHTSSPMPGAAIVKETVHGPLFEGPNSEAVIKSNLQSDQILAALMSSTEGERQKSFEKAAQLMDEKVTADRTGESIGFLAQEILEVIALLAPKPLFTLAHWYQRPVNIPLAGALGAYSGPTNDHPFHIALEKQDYPVAHIQALVAQYLDLDPETRKGLRTPLTRLNQGRRQLEHHTPDGAAIDFGIAAESLLTQDRDHDAPISFLLRARGALMLGGTAEERRENYNTLRALYELRSKVAHRGSIVDNAPIGVSEANRKRLDSAQRICTALIVAIIRQGKFPDWDALMFGW